MYKIIFTLLVFTAMQLSAGQEDAKVIFHEQCKEFSKNGICIKSVSQGSKQYEVWHSHIGPGSSTPRHMHETEELFVFFKGTGVAVVGDRVIQYQAPCTLVLPANVPHQVYNTGTEPTDHLAIIGQGSTIVDNEGSVMQLPWR